MATYKSLAMRDELAQVLAIRLSAITQTLSFDANANPCIQLGAATAGTKHAFLRILPVTSLQSDILGTAQKVFTPHVIQICFEASAGAGTLGLATTETLDFVLPVLAECGMRGTRVELFTSANAAPATLAVINAASAPATSFEPSVQYPTIMGQ